MVFCWARHVGYWAVIVNLADGTMIYDEFRGSLAEAISEAVKFYAV
jgi:hypothetical protein